MDTVLMSCRMALTAAPSAPFLSPRPTHRAEAIAPASVTLASSRARLRSGACLPGSGVATAISSLITNAPSLSAGRGGILCTSQVSRLANPDRVHTGTRTVMTTDQAVPVGKGSDRGTTTRSALLGSAREVFTLVGYAQAGVSDIVTLAGASVGSLYHHFSGKADLYLTLFEELSREHTERTRAAVRSCRSTGVNDPMQLFLAGARAYLDVCIEQRQLSGLFARGDGPPGFELLWRQRLADW